MKTNRLRFLLTTLSVAQYIIVAAQVNHTAKLVNPSFEQGNLSGWTWTGTTGYSWLGPNTDGDATKQGSYICGIWNAGIGDAECAQSVSGLPNGFYRVTALATVSNNRLTNQRLFANASSQLYGEASNSNYSAANLNILSTTFGETNVTFAGHPLSAVENGPFQRMQVITQVTDGTMKLGFRVSGRASSKGFVFTSASSKSDEGFFKFDHFTLTEVSKVATLDGVILNVGSLDTLFTPGKKAYTATLPAGVTTVQPTALPTIPGTVITGDGPVDVSTGTGTSTLVVTSLDGSISETYTLTYTVLTQSYQTVSDGIEFLVPNGLMKVKVCTDKIVQVSYVNKPLFPVKDTVMVNNQWDVIPAFTVTENGDTVTLATASLRIKVSKTSFLVHFYDVTGKLLLAEAAKTMTPATVLTTPTNNCTASFFSPADEALYGLGQHQQKIMNYKGHTTVLDQQNKEIALPFLLSTRGYGLLWDNYSYTHFFGNSASNTQYQFQSESGDRLDYYFLYGPQPDSIIHAYREATGQAPLFPKWAYGLFQSKDKYSSATELLTMVNNYRNAGFPLDCIVQDWDYWTPDVWGSHTVNATRYPDPKALIDSLHALNVHTMISIWPVFHKNTGNYAAYNAINALYPSTGNHHFYDPHNNEAKRLYWNQVNTQLFAKHGWDAWWADNNEPQGYPDGIDRKSYTTAKGPGVTYYNTYPIEHTAGFYAGWRKDHPEKRIFTLSRSAFPGQQRYATAAWSGDIHSTWADFQNQLSAGLNFTMSGIPYWTTDIGGYFYVDWSTANNNELMTRWFQYGAFCPIFRIHGQGDKSMVSTNTLTPNTISNMEKTSKLRYRLMPYIYALAGKVTHSHYTLMRHLVMDYPADSNVRSIDTQFLFGPAIMVNPITAAGVNQRSVYLPEGTWFDFWTGDRFEGSQTITTAAPLDRIPLFVKAGSIVPMGPHINYATASTDPIELRVYRGADGSFDLYEDDGRSYAYEQGAYSMITFTYDDQARTLRMGARKGAFDGMLANRTFNVVLVDQYYGTGLESPVTFDSIVHYNGNEAVVTFQPNKPIPTSHFEAETAVLTGGAVTASSFVGYSGNGYVTGLSTSPNARATFTVVAPETGAYQLSLRYAAGSPTMRRTVGIEVNQHQGPSIEPLATRDWNTWNTATTVVPLVKGTNSVVLTANSAYVQLDYIELNRVSTTAYQASSRIGRIKLADGSGYLTMVNQAVKVMPRDTTLRTQLWKLESTRSGEYRIGLLDGGSYLVAGSEPSMPVQTSGYTGQPAQQWLVDCVGTSFYSLRTLANGFFLSAENNQAVIQQSTETSMHQLWFFEDTAIIHYSSLYEPFDYPLEAELVGLGGNGQGWGSPWTLLEGAAKDLTVEASTLAEGLPGKGHQLKALASTNTALRVYRDLFPRWEDDGQTVWLSFILSLQNPTSLQDSWQGLSLYNGTSERVLIGKNWGRQVLGIIGYDAAEGMTTVNAFSLKPTWLVAKIQTSGNNNTEALQLWINPDPNVEPTTGTAAVSTTVQLNSGFDRLVFHMGNTAGIAATCDEIRLGRTYQQVTGSDPTSLARMSIPSSLQCLFDAKQQCLVLNFQSPTLDVTQVKLIDLNGRLINQYSHPCNQNHGTMSLQLDKPLNKGLYLVSVNTSHETLTSSLIIP
jgi:alpha-D-xyloside xylohydrolase